MTIFWGAAGYVLGILFDKKQADICQREKLPIPKKLVLFFLFSAEVLSYTKLQENFLVHFDSYAPFKDSQTLPYAYTMGSSDICHLSSNV